MRRNKLKPLPNDPLVWLSDDGRRVWSVVLDAIREAGFDDSRFVIPVGLLADAYGAFLQSCELKTSEYADARIELIRDHRERLVLVLNEFFGASLPHIEAGDELKACRLDASLRLGEIEAGISGTVAESDTWHGLLERQAAIHWKLVTLGLLIDSDEFIRRLEAAADDDSGESWKQGVDDEA